MGQQVGHGRAEKADGRDQRFTRKNDAFDACPRGFGLSGGIDAGGVSQAGITGGLQGLSAIGGTQFDGICTGRQGFLQKRKPPQICAWKRPRHADSTPSKPMPGPNRSADRKTRRTGMPAAARCKPLADFLAPSPSVNHFRTLIVAASQRHKWAQLPRGDTPWPRATSHPSARRNHSPGSGKRFSFPVGGKTRGV